MGNGNPSIPAPIRGPGVAPLPAPREIPPANYPGVDGYQTNPKQVPTQVRPTAMSALDEVIMANARRRAESPADTMAKLALEQAMQGRSQQGMA
jgi:hypothetical protein